MSKNPKFLQSKVGVTETQRKSLGLGYYVPRDRAENEATGTQISNSTTTQPYRTGDGDVAQHVRPGSMRAYSLPSRGI